MKNDRLPLIAHAHLATADYEAEGAKHWKCLQLAELHSTAVDYVKTGVPAQWNKKLDPRRYPHFMEKPRSKSYHSTSVLGKLYDMVDKEVFDNKENYTLPYDGRILKRYTPDKALLKETRKIKGQYDIAMRRIMGQLEIGTEFEIWTTFVMSRPRVGTDYKVQEKVGRESAGLKKQFRDLCLKVMGEHNFNKLEFIAGMYRVTQEETKIALHEARQPHVLPDGTVGLRRVTARSMPLISFPWLFPTELGKIALDTEKLPNLQDYGIIPPSAKPVSGGGSAVQPETELDLAGMGYTRTSDGQIIHRGEILHLFPHNDDSDDGFYYSEDAAGVDSSTDSGSESASKGEQGSQKGFPTLVDLHTALVDAESPTWETVSSSTEDLASLSTGNGHAADPGLLDLLSSDTDAGSDSSPYLTPVKVSRASQQEEDAAVAETKTTETVRLTDGTDGAPATSAALHNKHKVEAEGKEDEEDKIGTAGDDDKRDAESAVSGSNASNWDRVTTPAAVLDEDWEPVRYKSLAFCGGLLSTTERLSSAELWGNGRGYDRDATGGRQNAGRGGGSSLIQGGSVYGGSREQGWTHLAAYVDPFAPAKVNEAEAEVRESDAEVEHEEEVIEVDGETALERAARFGARG